MSLRKTRKKQKGGKILGAGADGCIFSESAWPCSTNTDISGYNISDTKFVAKMVDKSDNEDTIIAIAASILTGADAKHLIKNYGVCSPVDNTTTDSTKMAALDENMVNIMSSLANTYKPNACGELKGITSTEIQKTHKLLVNSRYNSDLHNYIKRYSNTANIISKVLKAAIPFSAALKKLATNSGNSLVNMDLHTGNIFVNFDTLGGPLTMGMADYGRCAYYDIKKSKSFNKQTWNGTLIHYMNEYDLQLNFPIVPIECRLFNSFILNTTLNNEEDIINHIIQLCEKDIDIIYESTDPFYFVGEEQLPKLLKIFTPFIKYVCNFPKLPMIEKDALLDFVLYRYNTIGFIGSLVSSLIITTEFRSDLLVISIAEEYIKFYGDPDYKHKFNMKLISHRLIKFYFDELLAPYMNDFSDIIQVRENEKNRDFTRIFADAMKLDTIIIPPGPPGLPPGLPPSAVVVPHVVGPRAVMLSSMPSYPVLPPRRNGKSVKTRRKRN